MSDILFQTLKTNVLEDFLNHYPKSKGLTRFVIKPATTFIDKCHTSYCWLARDWTIFERRQKRIQNNQGDPGVYGVGAMLLSQHISVLARLILAGLVVKCIDDLCDQYEAVYDAYVDLKKAIHAKPVYKRYRWQKADDQTLMFSPSLHLWVEIRLIRLLHQSLRIMRCLNHLFWEVIKLGLYSRDVYLILTHQPQAKLRALTELMLDVPEYLEKIREDQEFLRNKIIKKQILLNKILKKIGAPEISDSLLKGLKIAADYVPTGIQVGKEFMEEIWIPGKVIFLPLVPELEEDIPSFEAPVRLYSKKQQKERIQGKIEEVFNFLSSASYSKRSASWKRSASRLASSPAKDNNSFV
jgi:hypothetical protein